MKKALITGICGFVGGYLRRELLQNNYTVAGLDVRPGDDVIQADLLDAKQTLSVIKSLRPNIVIHLAGQPDVAKSWEMPQKTLQLNVIATVNIMEAVRIIDTEIRIVLIGSADEYGRFGEVGGNVDETAPLYPQSPYAVSKTAQEQIAEVYRRAYGLNICMTRSFNHAGVGQGLGFLIPDFAYGIASVEKGLQSCLKVGNLDAYRDFTHVKDIARAYRLIAEKGRQGEIYNVGSGRTYNARQILEKLLSMSEMKIPVEQDPAKMRPIDTPIICCNHDKLTRDTGWQPQISIEQILKEVLNEQREKISQSII